MSVDREFKKLFEDNKGDAIRIIKLLAAGRITAVECGLMFESKGLTVGKTLSRIIDREINIFDHDSDHLESLVKPLEQIKLTNFKEKTGQNQILKSSKVILR